ncbi:hypothetical protein INR49_014409 [Caranx melampygus]|nr:hypothetical protein INR49_014409 [Caranx melampygus]
MRKESHFLQASVGERAQYNQASSASLTRRSAWSPDPPCIPGLDRLPGPSQHREQGVSFTGLRLPTSCHLVFHFGQRVHSLFHSLCTPLPFCKQVKDVECVRLLPANTLQPPPQSPTRGERYISRSQYVRYSCEQG